MKVHINLLVPDERRNPGVMLIRTATSTLCLVACAAFVLYGLHALWMLRDAQRSQSRSDAQWKTLEADHMRAERLQTDRAELERLTSDLAAFSNAQISVSAQLQGLARCIPADVQLTEVVWSQGLIDDDGRAARQQTLKIVGGTVSEASETRVQEILTALRSAPVDFGTVLPGGIRVDPKAANASTVIFEIRCVLAPRRFQ